MVLDDTQTTDDDLVGQVTEVLTSVCTRLSGRRAAVAVAIRGRQR